MIYNTSVRLCDRLSQIGIIPECRKKIYIYGFELLLSSTIGILCLMVISAIAGKPLIWVPYLFGFIPLRITGGGYHAKTHFMCILSFSLVYSIFLLYICFFDTLLITYVVLSSITLIVSLAVAPVEAINKHLSIQKRKNNRKRCLTYASINVLITLWIMATGIKRNQYVHMYLLGGFAAGASMIAVRFFPNRSNAC